MVTIGVANIARWKIATRTCWEATAAGAIPTRTSLPGPQSKNDPGSLELGRSSSVTRDGWPRGATANNVSLRRSKPGGVDNGLGKGLRSFLGQVVTDTARYIPMLVSA